MELEKSNVLLLGPTGSGNLSYCKFKYQNIVADYVVFEKVFLELYEFDGLT